MICTSVFGFQLRKVYFFQLNEKYGWIEKYLEVTLKLTNILD